MEQDEAIRSTLLGRVDRGRVRLDELETLQEELKNAERIYITACGTAYHAGMVGAYLLRHVAGLDVEIEVASEFRYANTIGVKTPWGWLSVSQVRQLILFRL